MKKFDLKYLKDDSELLAGVDEAGRGPLAGPVVAAAVVFPNDFYIKEINDSKQLSAKKREELFPIITQNALSYSVCSVSHELIDQINILQASLLAMRKAVERLTVDVDIILVDGNKKFNYHKPIHTIIKGDSKSFSIAAASILAKVSRDRIMNNLAIHYPEYHWEKNKGYATKQHLKALEIYGESQLHRKTFLRKFYERQNQTELILSQNKS